LDNDRHIALGFGVFGQLGAVQGQRHFPVNLNLCDLGPPFARLAGAPLCFGRMVALAGGSSRFFAGLDLGLALLAFEPVVLVAKALVFLPQFAVFGNQLLNQVQQVDDRLASAVDILNVVRVE
jgi:hypothetical protein